LLAFQSPSFSLAGRILSFIASARLRVHCRLARSVSHSALGLYTRRVSANDILHIGYKTGTARQVSTKTGMVTMHPSTMIFDTTGGEVRIGHVSSAVDHSVERELILKTRAFLDAPDTLGFRYEANMHGMFGYVGLVGVAGLLFIFFSVLWHHLRKAISRQ